MEHKNTELVELYSRLNYIPVSSRALYYQKWFPLSFYAYIVMLATPSIALPNPVWLYIVRIKYCVDLSCLRWVWHAGIASVIDQSNDINERTSQIITIGYLPCPYYVRTLQSANLLQVNIIVVNLLFSCSSALLRIISMSSFPVCKKLRLHLEKPTRYIYSHAGHGKSWPNIVGLWSYTVTTCNTFIIAKINAIPVLSRIIETTHLFTV